ncbi:trans-sialidase [Trypanosoma cruzi cruzi]|uniref:Putative trans-sialidase, Group II n=1 Tax=Trypanosoma cruzi TaxID=5693 RepID=A0A2V2V7Q7_TRYCR|nr:trans-sialidase [Trypanosoma cruzi cruzi]PWU92420.1 putative trans-sialidase, Group II [Trypanosoma cruzi]
MLSRVAAVMAPRTDNRRRVTGSSGRRREGGESEPQRPNMSRHLFTSAVLLLLFVMMCCGTCGAAAAVESKSGVVQLPKWVDIFLPNKTQVVAKNGSAAGTPRDSFVSPSLVSAGGVITAFAGGRVKYNDPHKSGWLDSSDIVAGYISAAGTWPSIVAEITNNGWKTHTALGGWNGKDHVSVWYWPTAVARDNKVFLIAGGYEWKYNYDYKKWLRDEWDIQLVVGEVTQAKDIKHSKQISWGEPTSLLPQIPQKMKSGLDHFAGTGGSGIVMGNGTLVCPLIAANGNHPVSMITYSTDNGKSWEFPGRTSPADCFYPRITEWENGKLLMVALCGGGRKVFESRDMGKNWTEAIGTLSGVWTKSKSGARWDEGLHVGALITAIVEGRKVMLYTHKASHPLEASEPNALYLWVTDNNRTLQIGPVSEDSVVNKTLDSNLLYSDDALHLLQAKGDRESTAISLARLTDELKTIKSVLRTWAQLDASFSESSTPTAGLVGFLSNTSSGGDTWIDEYRCVDASVTKAAKVKNGFKFTGPGSMATWHVNSREDNRQYSFVNHRFTLVATVTIHQVPKGSTPLLGAGLGDGHGAKIIGLSCGMNKTWETVFDGKKTTSNTTWELGKEHQVALMLQDGNKGSVYVDGVIVGSPAKVPKVGALGHEITHFYFGGDEGDSDSSVTVTNVFLYNRPLSVGELKMVRKSDGKKGNGDDKKGNGDDKKGNGGDKKGNGDDKKGNGDDKKGNGDDKKGKGDGSMRGGISRLLLLLGLGFCASVALY